MAHEAAKPRSRTTLADWGFELTALVWSGLSLMGIVLLLVFLDGHVIFEWKHVSLNALISILTVSMKASLLFAVAELIGQWKWIWFSRDARPLIQFEQIDRASRGPAGSLWVLDSSMGMWPVRLGAVIMILALALDPFSPQLLQFRQGMVPLQDYTRNTYTKRSQTYMGGTVKDNTTRSEEDPSKWERLVTAQLEQSMQTAILNGIYDPATVIKEQKTTNCSTGACTWPQFQTLGVCHKCNDLTSDLKKIGDFGEVYGAIYEDEYGAGNGTAFVLPNGHFLSNINLMNAQCIPTTQHVYSEIKLTNSMNDIDTLIWSMSVINVDFENLQYSSYTNRSVKWPEVPIRATECALYYCVKTIDVKVEQNALYESYLSENATEDTDAKRDPDSWQYRNIDYWKENYGSEYVPPDDELANLEFDKHYSAAMRSDLKLHFPHNSSKPEYNINAPTVWSVNDYVRQLLSTNITESPSIHAAISKVLPNNSVGFNGQVFGSTGYPAIIQSIWELHPDVPGTFASLALSMTNVIRLDVGFRPDNFVGGITLTHQTLYKTEWGWIVLHGLLLLGGVLLWCLTVCYSLRPSKTIPAWKNSSLAVISRGFKALGVLMEADSVGEMQNRARNGKVKMPVESTSTLISAQGHGGNVFGMQRSESHDPPPYGAD